MSYVKARAADKEDHRPLAATKCDFFCDLHTTLPRNIGGYAEQWADGVGATTTGEAGRAAEGARPLSADLRRAHRGFSQAGSRRSEAPARQADFAH
jgi:hypothetical protein